MRILLTEDDERLSGYLAEGLGRAGWAVDVAASLEEARAALRAVRYRALVLDLSLPDGDGMDLLRELRRTDRLLPVLILTARVRLSDRVKGLNTGADDYLVKPLALEELVARLAAACRRADVPAEPALTLGRVTLETGSRAFLIDGEIRPLARRETMVLEALLLARGRAVPKQALEEALGSFENDIGANAVEVYVSRLRRRLAEAGLGIRADRGIGYRIVEMESP
ncbi:response regulator [Acetobacteraceae bacterium H6797]|nr:response regulator [Acetobacteraceae bacterium H6797]